MSKFPILMRTHSSFTLAHLKTTLPTVVTVLLAAGLTACTRPPEAALQELPRPVKVIELHNGGMPQEIEYPGQIVAVRQSRKSFDVAGRITEVRVKEGQSIRKGEVLARLDSRDFVSAHDSALAQYEAVQSVADRLENLYENRAVSRQALDLAQRDVRTASAALERAEKALEETELIADFDGKVARLLVDDFANVAAKQEVMIIQDDSLLEIAFNVPESLITIPDPGETREEIVAKTKPVVILSAVPDRSFPARFSEASETPDPATRTYEVKLVFDPPDDVRVQPGMTAKVRAWIPADLQDRTQGYPVPTNAVVSDHAGEPHLWKVDPATMRVSRVAVSIGALADDRVIVTGQVETGDLIVVSGVHQLAEGQTVRIWE